MAAADPLPERPLAGRRIAILEHRELDRLGGMLEAQGAQTLRCPLVAIADAADPEAVRAWLGRFVAAPPDDLVLMTGEGLRRLRGVAQRSALAAAFHAALGRVRTITRGPKPAAALRAIGLAPGLRAAAPTTAGIIAALAQAGMTGRRVAVQLYPDAPATLLDFLREARADADPVCPYAYVPAADDTSIRALIAAAAAGDIDALAFTSTPQVGRLFDAAEEAGLAEQLRAALAATAIAAVGPVVAGELEARGLTVAIMPRDKFFMKPLVDALAAGLAR